MTFDEFLKYFGWRELTLAIELKEYGIAAEVIDMIDRYGVRDKVIITSFKYEELVAAREYDKNIRLGLLYWGATDADRIEKLKKINAYQACPKALDLTEDELKLIYKNGFECRAWGISDTEIMKKATDMGPTAFSMASPFGAPGWPPWQTSARRSPNGPRIFWT